MENEKTEAELKEQIMDLGDEFKAGSNYLGKRHHPALGIRIPEIVLPGIVNALQKYRCAAGLMLSFGRETAPEEIISAPTGRYEITLGHTGTSIRKYLSSGARAARSAIIPVEMEADHLIITVSSAQAVKRIEGVKSQHLVGAAALDKSLRYNLQALDEAATTGAVRAFTTDTSDLFDDAVERLKANTLLRAFQKAYPIATERQRIVAAYVGKFRFRGADGKPVRLEVSKERAMKIVLKYRRSLEINARLYEEIKKRTRHPFAFEISMDETPKPSAPADVFIYLGEWKNMGYPVDYVAPNVGFKKREDYTDNMDLLKNRVRAMHAIAARYDALLSFHSGSGVSPLTGKGPGVYEALLECTGRRLKYKISGIYVELLLNLLASHKKGTDARILFELIYDEVMTFLRAQVEEKGPLYSDVLVRQLEDFDAAKKAMDPFAAVFRYHSFLCLNFRDLKGRRYYRDRLIRLYSEDLKLRKQVDQEIEYLTGRLIEGLDFKNNF